MSLFERFRILLAQTQAAGSRSMTLMAPSWSGCSVCGKAVDSKTAASKQVRSTFAEMTMPSFKQALCAACYSSIPWLERIKCPICGRGICCEDCQRRPNRHFVCNRSAVSYDPTMRSWLALYKYRGYERLAPVLAEMLVPPLLRMTQEISETERVPPHNPKSLWRRLTSSFQKDPQISACWDAITYVPISEQRAEERGFNQAREMASHLSNRFGIPLFDLLARDHHSEKMSFKSRAERIRDARTLFSVNEEEFRELEANTRVRATSRSERSRAIRILLVDDIYTTGSTVEACSAALLRYAKSDMRIYVLTWSRS